VATAIRDPVSPDLRKALRALKLGQMLATLPERLTLARQVVPSSWQHPGPIALESDRCAMACI
jgi:hypothetical protein